MLLSQQQIPQEQLQIVCRLVDAFLKIGVFRPDHGVAEVPGVFPEDVIRHCEAQGSQIQDSGLLSKPAVGAALTRKFEPPGIRNECNLPEANPTWLRKQTKLLILKRF